MSNPAPLKVSSQVVQEGKPIPMSAVYTGAGGQNLSPDLASGAPASGRESRHHLPRPGCADDRGLHALGALQSPGRYHIPPGGRGCSGQGSERRGPRVQRLRRERVRGHGPPPGDPPHRYQFTVWALDVPTLAGAGSTTTYAKFRFMIRGHVLAQGTLTGRSEGAAEPRRTYCPPLNSPA